MKYWKSAHCDVTKVSRFTPLVWSHCLGLFVNSETSPTVCKKRGVACELSQRASTRGPVSCCRTGNVPLKWKDASWTSLSNAKGSHISRSAPRGRTHANTFPPTVKTPPRVGRGISEKDPQPPHLVFSFYLHPFSFRFISQRSTPGVCSRDLFTSLIMDSGPDLSFPCRRPAGVSFRITTLT